MSASQPPLEPDAAFLLALIEKIQAGDTGVIASLLEQILHDLGENLEYFQVFVPELCIKLTRMLAEHQLAIACDLARALETVLEDFNLDPTHADFLASDLPLPEQRLFCYFLGRLNSALRMCSQMSRFELELAVEVEALEDPLHFAILVQLSQNLALKQRALSTRLALAMGGKVPGHHELRRALIWLRDKQLIEAKPVAGALAYSLTHRGRLLILRQPAWLTAVAEAYRIHRQGGTPSGSQSAQLLGQLFSRLDAEEPPPT